MDVLSQLLEVAMSAPSYRTVPLGEYSDGFRRVAEGIYLLARQRIGEKQIKKLKGSYSIVATSTQERTAKIVIYEQSKGRLFGKWPLRNDGVYILIRENGQAAKNIWEDVMPAELPCYFDSRISRSETIAVAPNHYERFAYFPVMAGENLTDIASLLVACGSA